ncbi:MULTISPECIES: DUF805 domain-containing protein [unclassified Halomonas]|uniref:DUF805 domain-containing protein n=1 Tax=unclassified Halomonas TaxID=2609666 RepID=UPI001C986570|nr:MULTISPECIES: DUF805 domain-containing protein [unclassified Halomonas]MBY5926836.1 DUF805 domain-containing protein [Halomonas sp. DP4Y7-2]MBY5985897.1 DUF805 domain-containing protein [Halomonas sp. DP5Y7-2]MBY6233878.1 DUF805 domain-containing protein [Halomonas sp. DP4Y7-1]
MTTEQATTTSPQTMPETPHPPVSNADSEHGSAITQHGTGEKAGLWSTHGRIGRVTYFNRTAIPGFAYYAISVSLYLMSMNVYYPSDHTTSQAFTAFQVLVGIPWIIFSLIQSKRRTNDIDSSGWILLLLLIPIVNIILAWVLTFGKGTEGENRYGEAPAAPADDDMAIFWISLTILIIGSLVLYSKIS